MPLIATLVDVAPGVAVMVVTGNVLSTRTVIEPTGDTFPELSVDQ